MIFKVQFSRWFFYIPLDDVRFFFTRSKKNECTPLFRLDDYLCLSVVVMAVHWRFFCFVLAVLMFSKVTIFTFPKENPHSKKKKKLSGLLLPRKVCIALRKLDVALSLVMAVAMMVLLVVAVSQPI